MQEYLRKKELKILIQKISSILSRKENCIVAIDGNCASGKSTLANELSQFFDTRIIHLDDFYLPRGQKDLSSSNDGNIDLKRFKEEIVNHLNEPSLEYRVFSCKEQKIVSSTILDNKQLTIVEGSYSLNPYFNRYYDLSIFMKIDSETQIKRLKERNKENYQDFINKWVVLENKYNNFYQIEQKSMLIIFNND